MNSPGSVFVTGFAWMGAGIPSIDTAIRQLFAQARREVTMSVYAFGCGVDVIFACIRDTLARGVGVQMVINKMGTQPQQAIDAIRDLQDQYPHLKVYDFPGDASTDLHAKVICVDGERAFIGSSNISQRGLLKNHELAVLVGGESAHTVAVAMARLLSSSHVQEAPR